MDVLLLEDPARNMSAPFKSEQRVQKRCYQSALDTVGRNKMASFTSATVEGYYISEKFLRILI